MMIAVDQLLAEQSIKHNGVDVSAMQELQVLAECPSCALLVASEESDTSNEGDFLDWFWSFADSPRVVPEPF